MLTNNVLIIIQGISSQTASSNLDQREGRTDISDVIWHLFSSKLMVIAFKVVQILKALKIPVHTTVVSV